jgi:hypothetical protein
MRKTNMFHLLLAPIMALVITNGFTYALVNLTSYAFYPYLARGQWYALLITIAYGLYLHFALNRQRSNYLVLLMTALASLFWSWILPVGLIWFAGQSLLFALMRSFILHRNAKLFAMDAGYVAIGGACALFLFPISSFLALTVFLVVQILCETRQASHQAVYQKDRFNESLKVAKQVLNQY